MPADMEWKGIYNDGERRVNGSGGRLDPKSVEKLHKRAAWLVTWWRLVSIRKRLLHLVIFLLWLSCLSRRVKDS